MVFNSERDLESQHAARPFRAAARRIQQALRGRNGKSPWPVEAERIPRASNIEVVAYDELGPARINFGPSAIANALQCCSTGYRAMQGVGFQSVASACFRNCVLVWNGWAK